MPSTKRLYCRIKAILVQDINIIPANMAHLTKAQLVSKICGDDVDAQSVLLKQPKEELLAMYRYI